MPGEQPCLTDPQTSQGWFRALLCHLHASTTRAGLFLKDQRLHPWNNPLRLASSHPPPSPLCWLRGGTHLHSAGSPKTALTGGLCSGPHLPMTLTSGSIAPASLQDHIHPLLGSVMGCSGTHILAPGGAVPLCLTWKIPWERRQAPQRHVLDPASL